MVKEAIKVSLFYRQPSNMEGKFTVFMLLFGAVMGMSALEDDGM